MQCIKLACVLLQLVWQILQNWQTVSPFCLCTKGGNHWWRLSCFVCLFYNLLTACLVEVDIGIVGMRRAREPGLGQQISLLCSFSFVMKTQLRISWVWQPTRSGPTHMWVTLPRMWTYSTGSSGTKSWRWNSGSIIQNALDFLDHIRRSSTSADKK